MSSVTTERLKGMFREFDAPLQKGDNRGGLDVRGDGRCRRAVRYARAGEIRGAIDGEPFTGALMPQGDGAHRLPIKAALRRTIGKQAGDTVHLRIDERIG